MSFFAHIFVTITLIVQGFFGGGAHEATIQTTSTPQVSIATTTQQGASILEISKTTQTVSVPKIATTSPTDSKPAATQATTTLLSDAQIGTNFFIAHDTCEGLKDNQYSYCVTYSMNHPTSAVAKIQAEQAAKAAADAKAKQEADAAALAALKPQIAANPIICSYTTGGDLYCNNLNSQAYNVESVSFAIIITGSNPIQRSGYLYPIEIFDANNNSLWWGNIGDRDIKTLVMHISLPANKSATSTNDRLVIHLGPHCAAPGLVGCFEQSDFQIVVNSINGRYIDGSEFTPKVQVR